MLKAIVFDFDGVIVDTEPLHYRAFLEVLRPHGVDFDYQKYLRDYIGFDDREGFRAICADHGVELTDERAEFWKAEKGIVFNDLAQKHATPLPGVVELILAASDRLPIAIASGATRADINAILPGIDGGSLVDRFRVIVTADDVVNSKPDPQSYLLAAEKLGVDPAETLAIEDTPAGISSALGAGMNVLGLTSTQPAENLSRADRIVESLEDVTTDQLIEWFA